MENIRARYITLGKDRDRENMKTQSEIAEELAAANQYLNCIRQALEGLPRLEKKQTLQRLDDEFKGQHKLELSDYFLNQSKQILSEFKAHSLLEQSGAALMDRVDRKYLLPLSLLPEFFNALKDDYTVLSEKKTTLFQYKTMYFDSLHDDFFHQHQSGKLNRHKVRTREYVNSNQYFLELKHKTNQFRTKKKRYLLTDKYKNRNINDLLQPLSEKQFPSLFKKLSVEYDRVTLKHKNLSERITFDLNIKFKDASELLGKSKGIKIPEVVIIEVKQDKVCNQGKINRLLKEFNLREVNFSKYCMGRLIVKMDEQLEFMPKDMKYNRFKECVLTLKETKFSFYDNLKEPCYAANF